MQVTTETLKSDGVEYVMVTVGDITVKITPKTADYSVNSVSVMNDAKADVYRIRECEHWQWIGGPNDCTICNPRAMTNDEPASALKGFE